MEEIGEPLMREIRYLDKLIDELTKGTPMGKILRGQEIPAVWICPKCGRSFRNANQHHCCGTAPAKPCLRQINEAIRACISEAKEKISWSMPTYWKGRNLIQFAAAKKHVDLYPGPEAVEAFAGKQTEYKISKGTIRFPYDKPIPLKLIAEIAKWCEARAEA